MVEEWRDIYFEEDGVVWDYRGLYQVSNIDGKVKSLNYRQTGKEKILKAGKNKDGYLFIILRKDGKQKNFLIHRLAAFMFIENDDPEHKTDVNHIDENKMNNHYTNLEWCTREYNINHGTHNERSAKARSGSKNPRSKKVIGYSLTDTKVIILQSTMQAKKFGFNQSNISHACRGKYCGSHEYKGFKWYYLDDYKNNK